MSFIKFFFLLAKDKDKLRNKSVKELKALDLKLSIDINKCVGKIHLLELILEARSSSDRYHEKYEHCFNGKVSNRKASRRRSKELPFNIDGTCFFRLKFQKDERIKSTKDGRS